MSQYSEIVGSFKRLGSYPIESDYIFSTVEELKEFYNDPINATTLHKGLLKVVENGGDGKQALYWVVRNDNSNQLEFVKLIQDSSVDTIDTDLTQLVQQVNQEIQDRKNWDQIIIGTDNYETIPSDLNSISDLANSISNIESLHTKNESDLKAVVGTDDDDIVSYLKTLPYTNLTEMANQLQKGLQGITLESNDSGTVDLDICRTDTGYSIKGYSKVSASSGNRLVTKNDGMFLSISSEYENGILTLRVNDNIIAQHSLGMASFVESATYDPESGNITIVFKSDSGESQEVRIPIGEAFSEHISDTNNPHKVTAEQLGVYTKLEEDALLLKKADLVDGKVPQEQIPDMFNWTVIE